MRRFYAPYTAWEDYAAGLYRLPSVMDSQLDVKLCANLLSESTTLYSVALSMIQKWPIAAAVNLTNNSRNRCAWVGQASCCFAHGAPEHITKEAWHTLSKTEQDRANLAALDAIAIWEGMYA